jgi:SAM-dependent methyltransferase
MSLRQVRADWTTLGAQDPLWAVLVSPKHRHGGWSVADFLATGRTEVSDTLAHLSAIGVAPSRRRALDFGCGVGRLSIALAEHVDEVIGVDISPTMLETAREFDSTGRCQFVENDREDLAMFGDGSFDLIVSSLALQHIPTRLARGYLSEMLRVLRPGGAAILQCATSPMHSVKGLVARAAPRPVMRLMQRRVLGYPAPLDMYPLTRNDVHAAATSASAHIIDEVDERMYGGHWRYTRYYLAKE